MTRTKMALIAGALTIASTGAIAQTMGPTAGVNFGSPAYEAYQARTNGSDSYASANRVRMPMTRASSMSRQQIDARDLANGYVNGGGVDLR